MHDPSRRRRLAARLAAGRGAHEDGWADELRVLPDGPAAANPVAEPAPAAPPAGPPVSLPTAAGDVDFPLADPPPGPIERPEPVAAEEFRPPAANPGPLPDPLPPPLDAAVRALREDLLIAGGSAAGLADEICARHRDRLRAALRAVPR